MFNVKFDDRGLLFSVSVDENIIGFECWGDTDACIYYLPLATLVDNGFAGVVGEKCLVPYENLYMLDVDDRSLLGLPKIYDKSMRLRGVGLLNASDFKYEIDLLSHVPDGDLLSFVRNENIVKIGELLYMLTAEQYELIRKVECFNKKKEDEKSADSNFRDFSEIKCLARKACCELDSYLQNENVFVPNKIKVELGRDEDGFYLEPSVGLDENDKFKRVFEKIKKVQSVYPIQKENGERIRIVLNKNQKTNLETLKRLGYRRKSIDEVRELTQRPTEYFDPDVFDISDLYSERVIELGIYKPKFSAFVSPYKSSWIVGASVKSGENGTTEILVKTKHDIEELAEAINKTVQNGEFNVTYKSVLIDVEDAKFLLRTSEKQFNSTTKIQEKGLEERKVLIIEENEEFLGFSTVGGFLERKGFALYKNQNLKDEFRLKTHQEEGVAWLQYLYENGVSGCLMADDMGLGKTLQILYFIDWLSERYRNNKPCLIVAPISLLENWESEYRKFFKESKLKVCCMTSRNVPRQYDLEVVNLMQNMSVVLTNYESLRISQLNFCAVGFDVVVLDEAQKIKTPGTLVTNAAKALKCKFKIAVTGTPVENSLLDLWCIMDFCVPGLLGNAKSFAKKYQYPLSKEDADVVLLGNEIHKSMGVHFMRRLKKDVAKDLPEKIEIKQAQLMPVFQEDLYRKVINMYVSGQQKNMLLVIMGIKTVSEHPCLYNSSIMDYECDRLIESSARLQATVEILNNIKEKDEKVIVFAERKECQKMIQKVCLDKYGFVAKIINGDTPAINANNSKNKESRQAAIDEFQLTHGFNVIIMSPVAAGMGLNVTAANHIVHYSRHWNPAKEGQATDRAYRIGQLKNVYVYYPMAVSKDFKSFDETLDDLLKRKTALADSTIFPSEKIEVNQEELGNLLFDV